MHAICNDGKLLRLTYEIEARPVLNDILSVFGPEVASPSMIQIQLKPIIVIKWHNFAWEFEPWTKPSLGIICLGHQRKLM